jgi:hypothetical protein
LWGGITAPAAQLANYPGQTGTSQPGNMGVAWHTVVITKATNAVTWVIDGIPIATVPADTLPNGNVFVGFSDLFPGASSVPAMSFALVDNLRVETYVSAPIVITHIATVSGNVEITFTGPPEASPGNFKLQSSGTVGGAYADNNTAVLSSLGGGAFTAVAPLSGSSQFYRIKR